MKTSSARPVIVAEWPLNKRERLRVTLGTFNGFDLINIRKWFNAGDGLLPGKQGIALQIKHLPDLANAVTKALAASKIERPDKAPADPGPSSEK